jgi:hypothetical protein
LKKGTKKFCLSGTAADGCSEPSGKSFLLLFFKKEVLPYLIATLVQPVGSLPPLRAAAGDVVAS